MVGNDGARPRGPRTSTPGRLLLWIALPILGVLACGLLLTTSIGGLRDNIGVVGTQAEPQVVAASRLSFDLASMDGQAADILLVGDAAGLSETRSGAYQRFESDQADADKQLELVGSGIEQVPNGPATYLAIETGLSQYTQYVSFAMYIADQAHGQKSGQPPSAALQAYDHASALLNTDGTGAQAQAEQLFIGEQEAESRPSDDGSATIWHLQLGCALLIAFIVVTLVLVQRRLSRVFRRMVNPLLALTTITTLIFGVLLFSALGAAKSSYDALNLNGPTSVVTLWNTRATTADMNASESRWLLDAGNPSAQPTSTPAAEQQKFTSDDQSVMSTQPSGNVATEFSTYTADDTHLRSLINGGSTSLDAQISEAVAYKTATSDAAYATYDADLAQVIGVEQQAFAVSTAHGENGLVSWLWLPWLWMAATIALILLGSAPRLREYR
ncbi:hypothetical protein [Actinospica sp.]|uniref:hypothetical protein n=1 Tax=Actinospica sp. TaxID=1872142 RepID=UPI002C5E8697|nr:hypothetical protein [Actinospica sp.]HWG24913.1 hypothetical protein [Actinospica sp.]